MVQSVHGWQPVARQTHMIQPSSWQQATDHGCSRFEKYHQYAVSLRNLTALEMLIWRRSGAVVICAS